MRKKLLSLLFLIVCAVSTYAVTYYVSPTGNNTNNGTGLTTPFQTIQKASDVAVSGDIVYVRAGTYREAVDIKANGVTFQPYNNEVVTINGTDLLSSWTLTSGNTYQTSAMTWDIDARWGSNQLFSDGKMIELVRWPKQTSSDIVMPTNGVASSVSGSGNDFTITDPNFNEPNGRWTGAKIWVNLAHNGYDGQGWTGTVLSTNQAAHTITVTFDGELRLGDKPWGLGSSTEFFLFNPTASGVNATGGINAILGNGEWWKNGSTLYVKTPNGAAPSASGTGTNVIEAKRRLFGFYPSVIRSGYTIKGFNLFACSITTDINAHALLTDIPYRQVIQEGANGITIDGINVKYVSHQTDMSGDWQDNHFGYTGIVISGRNNTLKNSTIQYAATSAVSITGADNKVLNNTIFDTNYMCSNSGTINTAWFNIDSDLGYNTIYNTTMMAINFKYGKNSNINVRDKFRIHHNTIYDFMRRSGDSGAIDKAVIESNWIRVDHNVVYTTKPVIGDMVHGIYLDYGGGPGENIGFITLDHNIIYDLPAPILLNQMDNVNIFNNVLLTNSNAFALEGKTYGSGVVIRNNIMSTLLNLNPDNLVQATISNNIYDIKGAKVNTTFANAPAGNFRLVSSATSAINTGISVGVYDENVVGAPDLGAYEYVASGDATSPSVPSSLASSNIAISSFNLSWAASSDNSGTVYYEVFRDNIYFGSTTSTNMEISGLVPGTTYNVKVKARDEAGNSSAFSTAINVTSLGATNLAAAGNAIGYRWSTNSNSTDNTNRVAESGMNDGNLSTSINLNGGVDDNGYAWEAGGVLFNTLQNNISSVNFIQGDIINGNSCFTNWLTMQYTLDGTVWNESNWRVSPIYSYGNIETAGKTFVFSGTPISGIKGVRVSGIVHTNDSSWVAYIKEVRAYATPIPDVTPPTVPSSLSSSAITSSSFTLSWAASTDNVGVANYQIFRGGTSIGTTSSTSFNVTGLTANTTYSMTVRALDAAGNSSAQSTPLNVTTLNSTSADIAYRWSNNGLANSDNNKIPEPGLNDGNPNVDIPLNNNVDDNFGTYESAGIIFGTSKSINKVEFVQGTYGGSWDNGSFDTGLRLQFTNDGTTWTDVSGWSLSPAYAYLNTSITGVTYTFTGAATTVKGFRITGQVHTNDYSGSWEERVREVKATVASTATNIASSGTPYFWNNIPSGTSTSNTTRGAAAGIKDGVLTVDVPLVDVTANGNWQAFGYTWTTNQSIGSIKYYNGEHLNNGTDNGSFTANMKVQSSTDGTTWSDVSGWTISPAYPYSPAASNQIYIISGPVLTGRRGIRVIGQVRTNDLSWSIKAKEVQVYATTGGATMDVSEKQELSKNINAEVEVEVYPNPARNEFSVSTKGEQSNITILSIDGRVMGRASGKGILSFNSSNWSSGMYLIKVENTKGSTIKKLVVVK